MSSTPSLPTVSPATAEKDYYDVMLLYEWNSGKEITLKIKTELESRGLRIWFDENEMRANMYDRTAKAITKSLVISPLLTAGYSRSANCKRELSYAADLKKQIEPTRSLKPNENLEPWVTLITAGLLYYDFRNTLNDDIKFNNSIESLYKAICSGIHAKADERPTRTEPIDSLTTWLRPVDFTNDLTKFRNDYVPGTRRWAVKDVHRWLEEDLNSFLCLNGGAEYREFVLNAMENDGKKVAEGKTSMLFKPSISFQELIVDGLQQIQQPRDQFVIIIDALDEVGVQGDPVRDEFLNLIRYQVQKLPRWVRVFTTGRPEMDIFKVLNGVNFAVLAPQDENNIQDIRLFVQYQISTHLWIGEEVVGTQNGLEEERLKEMVMHITEKSGGVFHYARLACNSLTESSYESWDAVMQYAGEFDGGLDQIYSQALDRVFIGANRITLQRCQLVLGVIITAKEPLHKESVARLLGMTLVDVAGIVLRIQSILTISNGFVKVLHKSLKDFLSSLERCKIQHFFVDTHAFESIMATSCLQVLTTDLLHVSAPLILSQIRQLVLHPTLSIHVSRTHSILIWIDAMALLDGLSDDVVVQLGNVAKWVAPKEENGYNTTIRLLENAAGIVWRIVGAKKIVKEIHSNEKKHLNSLVFLEEGVIEPLRETGILSNIDIDRIFKHFEPICNLSLRVESYLRAVDNPIADPLHFILDIFLNKIKLEEWKVYETYFDNYHAAKQLVSEIFQREDSTEQTTFSLKTSHSNPSPERRFVAEFACTDLTGNAPGYGIIGSGQGSSDPYTVTNTSPGARIILFHRAKATPDSKKLEIVQKFDFANLVVDNRRAYQLDEVDPVLRFHGPSMTGSHNDDLFSFHMNDSSTRKTVEVTAKHAGAKGYYLD
ncbi:POC1 centriolar protein A [Blyttiomyces sp. JEL0837]|nr:POC1 centriolar protein A [Blyttiomyces sp. JEL0837]